MCRLNGRFLSQESWPSSLFGHQAEPGARSTRSLAGSYSGRHCCLNIGCGKMYVYLVVVIYPSLPSRMHGGVSTTEYHIQYLFRCSQDVHENYSRETLQCRGNKLLNHHDSCHDSWLITHGLPIGLLCGRAFAHDGPMMGRGVMVCKTHFQSATVLEVPLEPMQCIACMYLVWYDTTVSWLPQYFLKFGTIYTLSCQILSNNLALHHCTDSTLLWIIMWYYTLYCQKIK